MQINKRKGFTLAELLIVVAIIGVLTAVAIPVFSSQLEKSREATDIANLRSAKAAAVAKYLADDLTEGTYYFDAQKGVLVSEDNFTDGSITGYGKGTDKNGAISNSFETSAIANGTITMSWVDTDGTTNERNTNYTSDSDVSGQIIKITFDNGTSSGGSSNPGGSGSSETCTHPNISYRFLSSGWHTAVCSDCGINIETPPENCTFVDGTCTKCGNVCDHSMLMSSVPNLDKTHTAECMTCGSHITEDCTLNYTFYANGAHSLQCTKCGYNNLEDCTSVDGTCSKCGGSESCTHINAIYMSTGMGSHMLMCGACESNETENCTYVDGVCSKCREACDHMGASFQTGVCSRCGEACTHTNSDYMPDIDGMHSIRCNDCGHSTVESCTFVDSTCTKCRRTCDHASGRNNHMSNGNGTHKIECSICGYITNEACTLYYTSLGDDSNQHMANCEDCANYYYESCTYVDGICSKCGATEQ